MKVLLIEPPYKNKYPPLGLMKISAFHKERGDSVTFVKGLSKEKKEERWDRIYITTLFSFYWSQTLKTIKYYMPSVKDPRDLFIGGPMATVMAREIEKEIGVRPVKGLLDKPGKLRLPNDHLVDGIVPDYSILDEIDYVYPANNAYFGYMTRGCIRKCRFCAVTVIEPQYISYIPLKEQIEIISDKFGEKKDLLLLDNNILASPKFNQMIDEIISIGFYKGAKLNGRNRYVDFNQGVDLRLLTKEKMRRLAEIPVRPLRIAFDHIGLKDKYIEKIEWAAEFGMVHLSNYILYNYTDTPKELYERLKISVDLNEKLGTQIFSFPMKYIPVKNKDRRHVGRNWTQKHLRGIQCILNATHGVVGPKRKFFETAFGRNLKEFKKLLLMPDDYIIYRSVYENNGAADWNNLYNSLSSTQKDDFLNVVHKNEFGGVRSKYLKVNALLGHYRNL